MHLNNSRLGDIRKDYELEWTLSIRILGSQPDDQLDQSLIPFIPQTGIEAPGDTQMAHPWQMN